MPVIKALPGLEVIRGLKGILDFYYWKGIPCVRKWPVIPPSSRSPASLASAQLFGAVIQGYSLLGAVLKVLFAEDAADHPRTARDLYVSGVLGHLHEIHMDEVIALLEQNNAYLLALQDVLNALNSIGSDLLITMPAHDGVNPQQLLVDASKRLQVRGQDQLFSFKEPLAKFRSALISGAGGYLDSSPCPADEIWCVTSAGAYDTTTPTTKHRYRLIHGAAQARFYSVTAAIAAATYTYWTGLKWLAPTNTIRVDFVGGLAGDTCGIALSGYIMTLET